jgi:hypothetical protein
VHQPLDQLRRLVGDGIGLPANNALKGAHRRRQLVVRALQHRRHGPPQVLPAVDVAVGPADRQVLRYLGDVIPADGVAIGQLPRYRLDLQIVLMALVRLQRSDELLHLAEGLLVVDGQQHPGLDKDQLGSHRHKVAGHFQIQCLRWFIQAMYWSRMTAIWMSLISILFLESRWRIRSRGPVKSPSSSSARALTTPSR